VTETAEFAGRVTLVTGAGSGIGRVVARQFAHAGAVVCATDLSLAGAEETVELARADGSRDAVARRMDVTNAGEVSAVVDDVVASLGHPGILVNCAGVSSMARFLDLTEADWDTNMDVNAKGVFLVTQRVVRDMAAHGGGCVVSISSAAGKGGGPFLAHYCASKWAVIGLTQSVAREMADKGIRANAVCPGCVRTPMQAREVVWEAELRGVPEEQVIEGYIGYTPLGRLCEPEDVADVIMFLCSEKARFMTGQAVNVTGGIVMH
jgi:meso-butanediol dehydrogenase/(S,S)-butanediol dehydrogenase/diacetyl reductase